MFRNLAWSLKQNTSPVCLSEVDCLYKETVSQLPICVRSAYCESLIHRSKFDLESTSCEDKKKSLTELIMAAQNEINHLSENRMV